MKHLLTYKLFESNSESPEEIIQYLKDIFRELEDSGHSISITLETETIELDCSGLPKKEVFMPVKDNIVVTILSGAYGREDDPNNLTIWGNKRYKYLYDIGVKDAIESSIDYMWSVNYSLTSSHHFIDHEFNDELPHIGTAISSIRISFSPYTKK